MPKYKILIAYDGTRYSGWQVQPNATSIQTHVENALSIALRQKTTVVGAGRTDSGVHALEQAAHFTAQAPLDLEKLRRSLNGLLPVDIRILSIESVPEDFHARYSAESKIYRYHLHVGAVINPFTRLYSYHPYHPVNIELLKKAARYFVGTHDFTSFSNEAHRGCAARDAVRTIKRLDLLEYEDEIVLEFEGDGFLYKMVRNIVGTLLDAAAGKLSPESIPSIFEAKDRRLASATAPAHGLFLAKVHYPLKFLGIASKEE